jgi:hypothetical protein
MSSQGTLTFNRESCLILIGGILTHLRSEAVQGITEFSRHQNTHIILIPLTPSNPPTVEVAIHTILYVRQIYPADLFVRRKKYETPVYQSRHPGLNEYIAGAVKAIGDELVLVSTPTFSISEDMKPICFST